MTIAQKDDKGNTAMSKYSFPSFSIHQGFIYSLHLGTNFDILFAVGAPVGTLVILPSP